MSERVMARVARIDGIKPIEGADAIELAIVGGWQVVVKKNEYGVKDYVIFAEIDSWIPHTIAPFLTKPDQHPRVYNGVEGQKLRTIRLRGELSQGLILPLSVLPDHTLAWRQENEGLDVTEALGIQKWEPPVNTQLAGISKGGFPSAFPKTDQERIQNLTRQLEKWKEKGLTFTVQEKLEGSSMTCFILNGEFGVCSRNLNLKETEGNTFWQVARELDIENKMRLAFAELIADGEGVAIQGELIGPGVQGNIYGLTKPTMRVFDIVYEKGMKYARPDQLQNICHFMDLETVPFLDLVELSQSSQSSVQNIIKMAEGKSILNPKQEREGIVFKCNEDPSVTFKAISNKYLLKQQD